MMTFTKRPIQEWSDDEIRAHLDKVMKESEIGYSPNDLLRELDRRSARRPCERRTVACRGHHRKSQKSQRL